MELSETFDTVAARYDAERAGYPEALFDDLAGIAGLAPGSRVLELGCGSGQATVGFAARGLDITGVEPGAELVRLARQRFAQAPNVRFSVTSFEAWPLQPHAFDLVAAAQSWHWMDPESRFEKAAQALAPGGHLAVFGHTPMGPADPWRPLAPVFLRLAPELAGSPPPEVWYLPAGPVPGLFAASSRFEPVQHRSYTWTRRYSPRALVAYLGTRSDFNVLPADRRGALLAEIEAYFTAAGCNVELAWATNLYVARLAS